MGVVPGQERLYVAVQALRKIADQDYRGNQPREHEIADEALATIQEIGDGLSLGYRHDIEVLKAAREWVATEYIDAPSGSDTRLTYALLRAVLDDVLEARGA